MIEKPAEHHSQNDLSATVAPNAFDFRGYGSESAMVHLKDLCRDSNPVGMTLLLRSCSGGYARLSVELLNPGCLIVFIPGTSWRLVPRLPASIASDACSTVPLRGTFLSNPRGTFTGMFSPSICSINTHATSDP
jgi:hypothetical protein